MGERSPTVAPAHNELGVLLIEWNDLESAAEQFQMGIELSQRSGNWIIQCEGYRNLSLLQLASGERDVAEATLQKSHQLALSHEVSPLTLLRNAACQVQLALALNDVLIAGTLREARRGAQIVRWSEMAGGGVEEDAKALIDRVQQVAQQEGIYVGMGLEIHFPGQDRPWENKLVMIASSGEVVIDHDKFGATFLYSMMGAGAALQGEFTLKTASTPYGTLTGVVCWDADFPAIMRQAGKSNADILFVANGDPEDATATGLLHAQQHIIRAIENGVSLVRQDAHSGLSVAADPYGRVLALVDLHTTSQRVMVAQVPTHGVFTLYSVIGDLFGWLSVTGFVVIAGWAIYRGRKSHAEGTHNAPN
jgi:apolipoprotein N-acyltransferase